MKKFEKKTWLIPANHSDIGQVRELIPDLIAKKGMSFSVPPDAVDRMDTFTAQNFICVLEHYPEAIEPLLFGINFMFKAKDGNGNRGPINWHAERKYLRWFNKIGEIPFMAFFIRNPEERFYSIVGNMVAEGKVRITDLDKTRQTLKFEGRGLQLIMDRMWEACVLMMIYCTGAPFDVVPYIEVFIAEFDTTFTIEQVIAEYEKRMEKGFEYQARGYKNKK